jgi:hypothetical protein
VTTTIPRCEGLQASSAAAVHKIGCRAGGAGASQKFEVWSLKVFREFGFWSLKFLNSEPAVFHNRDGPKI